MTHPSMRYGSPVVPLPPTTPCPASSSESPWMSIGAWEARGAAWVGKVAARSARAIAMAASGARARGEPPARPRRSCEGRNAHPRPARTAISRTGPRINLLVSVSGRRPVCGGSKMAAQGADTTIFLTRSGPQGDVAPKVVLTTLGERELREVHLKAFELVQTEFIQTPAELSERMALAAKERLVWEAP